MSGRTIGVLIVDDSKLMQRFLAHLLERDPQLRVVGLADTGAAALEFLRRQRPDVILMDIHMPGMDGFETTRLIMESDPVPIVICSGTSNLDEVATTFRLMEAGAVGCVPKPVGAEHPEHQAMSAALLETVRLMSEVKVVRRWSRSRAGSASRPPGEEWPPAARPLRAIGIGASTGGPPVLHAILSALPADFPVPILIVQHIARGFLPGLIEWLARTSRLRVEIAAYGVTPQPGHAYLAPDDYHLEIGSAGRLLLTKGGDDELKPSVARLFRSLAEVHGAAAVGVLLTGMGRDGAAELKLMRDRGALTIAQDRESSVVHGMPGEAIRLAAATHVLPVERIADLLIALAAGQHARESLP